MDGDSSTFPASGESIRRRRWRSRSDSIIASARTTLARWPYTVPELMTTVADVEMTVDEDVEMTADARRPMATPRARCDDTRGQEGRGIVSFAERRSALPASESLNIFTDL